MNQESNEIIIERNLAEILHELKLVFNRITVKEEDGLFRANIQSDDEAKLIIGKRGENINAIQHLLKNVVRKELGKDLFIVLDADNYKRRREENALSIAKAKARKSIETGSKQKLPPMSPYFRRVVHLYFKDNQEFKSLKTQSAGEGDFRFIEIIPKQSGEKDLIKTSSSKKSKEIKKENNFEDIEKIDEVMDF